MTQTFARDTWRGRVVSSGLAIALCATIVSIRAPARADVDLTGNFFVSAVIIGFPIVCSIDITQTGTMLAATGTCDFVGTISLTGTIDPMTGVFSGSGNATAICTAPGTLVIAATATLDSSSFAGTVTCDTLMGTVFGSRCGNGQLDAGEACDQGNLVNGTFGSCCSSTCQFAATSVQCRNSFDCSPAEFCTGASESCPADVHDPDGTACGTNNLCMTGQTCTGGVCGGGTPEPQGTPCGDPEECAAFECDGTGACEFVFTTDPCDDFDACTTNDACADGICQGGPPLNCGACSSCDSVNGCFAAIDLTCKKPTVIGSPLAIGEGDSPARNKIVWKWLKGELTAVADFGDPRTTTSYTLCVYDQDAGAFGGLRLMLSATAPAGANWSPTSKGYKYKDSTLSPDGLQKVVLKEGADGKARISVIGKDANLDLASLPGTLPITVQLKASNGMCWDAGYTAADPNNPVKLKGKGGP